MTLDFVVPGADKPTDHVWLYQLWLYQCWPVIACNCQTPVLINGQRPPRVLVRPVPFQVYADPALRDMIPLSLSLYEEDADLFFSDVAHMLSREGSHQADG